MSRVAFAEEEWDKEKEEAPVKQASHEDVDVDLDRAESNFDRAQSIKERALQNGLLHWSQVRSTPQSLAPCSMAMLRVREAAPTPRPN